MFLTNKIQMIYIIVYIVKKYQHDHFCVYFPLILERILQA